MNIGLNIWNPPSRINTRHIKTKQVLPMVWDISTKQHYTQKCFSACTLNYRKYFHATTVELKDSLLHSDKEEETKIHSNAIQWAREPSGMKDFKISVQIPHSCYKAFQYVSKCTYIMCFLPSFWLVNIVEKQNWQYGYRQKKWLTGLKWILFFFCGGLVISYLFIHFGFFFLDKGFLIKINSLIVQFC